MVEFLSFESSWSHDRPPPPLFFAPGDSYVLLAVDAPWEYEQPGSEGGTCRRYLCNVVTPELLQSRATSCRILKMDSATMALFRADPTSHWTRITRLPSETRGWLCIADVVRAASPDDVRRALSMMPWNLRETADQYIRRAVERRDPNGGTHVAA